MEEGAAGLMDLGGFGGSARDLLRSEGFYAPPREDEARLLLAARSLLEGTGGFPYEKPTDGKKPNIRVDVVRKVDPVTHPAPRASSYVLWNQDYSLSDQQASALWQDVRKQPPLPLPFFCTSYYFGDADPQRVYQLKVCHIDEVRQLGRLNPYLAYHHSWARALQTSDRGLPMWFDIESKKDAYADGRPMPSPWQVRRVIMECFTKLFSAESGAGSRAKIPVKAYNAVYWESASSSTKISLHAAFVFLRAPDGAAWRRVVEFVNHLLVHEHKVTEYHVDHQCVPGGSSSSLRATLCDKWTKSDSTPTHGDAFEPRDLSRGPASRPLLPMVQPLRSGASDADQLKHRLNDCSDALHFPSEVFLEDSTVSTKRKTLLSEVCKLLGLTPVGDRTPCRIPLERVILICCPDPSVADLAWKKWKINGDQPPRCINLDGRQGVGSTSVEFANYCTEEDEERNHAYRTAMEDQNLSLVPRVSTPTPSLITLPAYIKGGFAIELATRLRSDAPPYAKSLEFFNQHVTFDNAHCLVYIKSLSPDARPEMVEQGAVAGMVSACAYRPANFMNDLMNSPYIRMFDDEAGGAQEDEEDDLEGFIEGESRPRPAKKARATRVKTKKPQSLISFSKYWYNHAYGKFGGMPVRGCVESVVFRPIPPTIFAGVPEELRPVHAFMPDLSHQKVLNMWSGLAAYNFSYPPEAHLWDMTDFDNGGLSPELKLVLFFIFMLCGCDDVIFTIFIHMWSSILVAPHLPCNKCFLIRAKEGIGKTQLMKNLVNQLVGPVHGLVTTGLDQVSGKWANCNNMVAVFADEAETKNKAETARLNAVITERTILTENKFQTPEMKENFITLFWASNSQTPLLLRQNARRFIMPVALDLWTLTGSKVSTEAMPTRFVHAVAGLLDAPLPEHQTVDKPGACPVLWEFAFHLLHRVDNTDWLKNGRMKNAPVTDAMAQLVNASASQMDPMACFVQSLIVGGSNLPKAQSDLARLQEMEARDAIICSFAPYNAENGSYSTWFRLVPLILIKHAYEDYVKENFIFLGHTTPQPFSAESFMDQIPGIRVGKLWELKEVNKDIEEAVDRIEGHDKPLTRSYSKADYVWFPSPEACAQRFSRRTSVHTANGVATKTDPLDVVPVTFCPDFGYDHLPAEWRDTWALPEDAVAWPEPLRFCLYQYERMKECLKKIPMRQLGPRGGEEPQSPLSVSSIDSSDEEEVMRRQLLDEMRGQSAMDL